MTINGPTECKYFQSLGQRYSGSKECDLELRVSCHGDNALEVELINNRYRQQCINKIKQSLLLVSVWLVFDTLSFFKIFSRGLFFPIVFSLWLLLILYSSSNLIKSEKFLYCYDFALQLQTKRWFSRTTNVFIEASNIFDVVINEVIEDLDIHYILIIRTKGDLFINKPIITIFNDLHPPLKCLGVIYKYLTEKMRFHDKMG